jgi:hypothetical protein
MSEIRLASEKRLRLFTGRGFPELADEVATELGIALAKQGHKIHFISYSQPVRLDFFSENIFYHEVLVSNYPLFDYQPYELVLASKLVDVVKHENLDLLHVHYAIPHASAAYMAQQILAEEGIIIPFITTLHGTDEYLYVRVYVEFLYHFVYQYRKMNCEL